MKEQLINFETAKLAKEKGFDEPCSHYYILDFQNFKADGVLNKTGLPDNYNSDNIYQFVKRKNQPHLASAPTQSLLQKFIRETRGVHIEIHRNASGYYWSMCEADGGTDLGWSDHSGPNDGGVWESFEGALENALQVQLSYDLPNDTTIIKHWGNYAEFALKSKTDRRNNKTLKLK